MTGERAMKLRSTVRRAVRRPLTLFGWLGIFENDAPSLASFFPPFTLMHLYDYSLTRFNKIFNFVSAYLMANTIAFCEIDRAQ